MSGCFFYLLDSDLCSLANCLLAINIVLVQERILYGTKSVDKFKWPLAIFCAMMHCLEQFTLWPVVFSVVEHNSFLLHESLVNVV
jgi:hypothetical protein